MFEIERDPLKPETPHSEDSAQADYHLGELDFVPGKSFRGGSRRTKKQIAQWSVAAMLIDHMFCLSASFILSSALLYFSAGNPTKINLLRQGWPFLALYSVTVFNYLLIFRAFLGFTLGEWSCHLRLGRRSDYDSASYLWKVFLRNILISISCGVIPLLSFLNQRDIAGDILTLRIETLK